MKADKCTLNDQPGESLGADSHKQVCYSLNKDEFCVQNRSLTSDKIRHSISGFLKIIEQG